jgi:hypothetical protein
MQITTKNILLTICQWSSNLHRSKQALNKLEKFLAQKHKIFTTKEQEFKALVKDFEFEDKEMLDLFKNIHKIDTERKFAEEQYAKAEDGEDKNKFFHDKTRLEKELIVLREKFTATEKNFRDLKYAYITEIHTNQQLKIDQDNLQTKVAGHKEQIVVLQTKTKTEILKKVQLLEKNWQAHYNSLIELYGESVPLVHQCSDSACPNCKQEILPSILLEIKNNKIQICQFCKHILLPVENH